MQKKGLQRNTIDKFYTKPEVVELCRQSIVKLDILNDKELIIEPSAGNGAFIEMIQSLTKNALFYDISPDNPIIVKKDFLEIDDSILENAHCIGNPPFGRQSSMAIKFIKKAHSCKSISFILPKSFKKESMKNKFPLHFHLVCEIDLPSHSFLLNEKEYDVPCIFQIWLKKENKRDAITKYIEKGFKFVKKEDNPHISFRRVGVYAGKIDKDIDKSPQSHYFIRFDRFTNKLFKSLQMIEFECSKNTVGPKSISKQELIKEYNLLMSNPTG